MEVHCSDVWSNSPAMVEHRWSSSRLHEVSRRQAWAVTHCVVHKASPRCCTARRARAPSRSRVCELIRMNQTFGGKTGGVGAGGAKNPNASERGIGGLRQTRGWRDLEDEEMFEASEDSGRPLQTDTLRRFATRALSEGRGEALERMVVYLEKMHVLTVERDDPMRYSELHDCLREAMQKKLWQAGLALLRFMETAYAPARISTYAVAASGLATCNRVRELQQLVYRLLRVDDVSDDGAQLPPTPKPDEKICMIAANVAIENNNLQIAVRIADDMEKKGIKLSAFGYSVLIKGYGRKKRIGDVKRQLVKMKRENVSGDLVLYNTAVDAFVRAGMLKLAQNLVQKMQEDGVMPDRVTYNTILKGLAQARRLRDAFRLEKQMRDDGYTPDNITRNTLIDGCMQLNRLDDALRLLGEGNAPDADRKDLVVAYSTIINGLALQGDITAGADLLDQMTERYLRPNVVTYTSLISAAMKQGAIRRAWRFFRQMEAAGITPDASTFKALISGLCARKSMEGLQGAFRVLSSMRRRGHLVDVDTYNMLLNGYIDLRKTSEAEQLRQAMIRNGLEPDVVTYTTLLKGYGLEGRMDDVRRVFREMRTANVDIDLYALNTLLASCIRAAEVQLALRLFREICKSNTTLAPDVYSYTTLISGLCVDGKVEEAWKIYREMKRKGVAPGERAIETLAKFVNRGGRSALELREASILLQDAKAAGLYGSTLESLRTEVEALQYMTSEKWKERDDNNEGEGQSASGDIFRNHDWNEIDSSFRLW